MPDFSIAIPLKGIDKVSVAFQSMSKSADKFGAHSTKAFDKASKSGSRFKDIVKGVLAADVIRSGVGLMVSGFKTMIGEASKLENSLTKFKVLLKGDEAAAKAMVEQLNILGAETPFEFEDLSNATTMLLGFNAATKDNVIPTLRMLGDLSLGNAENMKGVTLAFSQIKAAGKASMQDVNQLINAQVPILATLADQWGVTVGQAREMISKGKATSDEIEKAFKKMTSATGQFHDGMKEASKTFSGMTSTLSDSLKQTAAGIGMQLLPSLKLGVGWLTDISKGTLEWVIANKDLINTKINGFVEGLKSAFKTMQPFLYAAFKVFVAIAKALYFLSPIFPILIAGLLAYNAALKVQMAIQAVQGIIAMGKALRMAGIAQWFLNSAMMANPIALIVAGIAGLIALFVVLEKKFHIFSKAWTSIKGFFGGEKPGEATTKRAPAAPNQREAEARAQNVNFKGELNINGAPQGSTVKSNTRGAPGVNMKLAGQN